MANTGKGAQRGFNARLREDEISDGAVSAAGETAGGIENGISEFLRMAHEKLVGVDVRVFGLEFCLRFDQSVLLCKRMCFHRGARNMANYWGPTARYPGSMAQSWSLEIGINRSIIQSLSFWACCVHVFPLHLQVTSMITGPALFLPCHDGCVPSVENRLSASSDQKSWFPRWHLELLLCLATQC